MSLVIDKGHGLAQILLLNPVAQAVQDARHVLISDANPTLYQVSGNNIYLAILPIAITLVVFVVGAVYFKRSSPHFAENI